MIYFAEKIDQRVKLIYKSKTSDKAIVKSKDGKYRRAYFSTLVAVV